MGISAKSVLGLASSCKRGVAAQQRSCATWYRQAFTRSVPFAQEYVRGLDAQADIALLIGSCIHGVSILYDWCNDDGERVVSMLALRSDCDHLTASELCT